VTRLRRATRHTFRSLRVRNYRLFYTGQLVSLSGTWMQYVAQDWLVLRLGGRGTELGLVTGLQFLPMLVGGPWGGLIADRFDKRRVLLLTQSAMAGLALVLGLLVLTDTVTIGMVWVLAFLLGCANLVDVPTRQAFVSEMVGPDEVVNAVGLNSALFNAARVVGPGLAGVVIATVDVAPTFFLNAASYLGAIVALSAMDPARLYRVAPAPRARGQVREGIRYVWRTPELRFVLGLITVVSLFGMNYRVVLPLLARFTFNGDVDTYGTMAAVMAAGALAAALATAGRGRPTLRLLAALALGFGVAALAAALAPTLGWELAALVPTGGAGIAFVATGNSFLQLRSDPAMRGRVMALYALVFLGSNPIGAPVMGWIAEHWGARTALGLGATVTLVAGLVALVRLTAPAVAPERRPDQPAPAAALASARG
jgi:MFS family permease